MNRLTMAVATALVTVARMGRPGRSVCREGDGLRRIAEGNDSRPLLPLHQHDKTTL